MIDFSPEKENIYKRKSKSSNEVMYEKVKSTYSLCLEDIPSLDKNNENEIQKFICKILNFLENFSLYKISITPMKEIINRYVIFIQAGKYLLKKNEFENNNYLNSFGNNIGSFKYSNLIKEVCIFVEKLKFVGKNSLTEVICFSDENDFEKIDMNLDMTNLYKILENKFLKSKNINLNINNLFSKLFNFLDVDNSYDNFMIIFPIINYSDTTFFNKCLKKLFKIFSDQYLSALFAPLVFDTYWKENNSQLIDLFDSEEFQEFLFPQLIFRESFEKQSQNILNNLEFLENECYSLNLKISQLYLKDVENKYDGIEYNNFNKLLDEYINKGENINLKFIMLQRMLYREYIESRRNNLRTKIFEDKVCQIKNTKVLDSLVSEVKQLNSEYLENKFFIENMKKNYTTKLNQLKFSLENFMNKLEGKGTII
jgi:hypothetical protein